MCHDKNHHQPCEGGLLQLASELLGCFRREEIVVRALHALHAAYPETEWVLFDRRAPAEFQETKSVSSGQRDQSGQDAIQWHAHPGGGAEPIVVLGVRVRAGSEPPDPAVVNQAATLIANALDGARELENVIEGSRQDSLTGVLNRQTITQLLACEEKRGSGGNGPVSVLFLDVDRFKSINDLHGHAIGDAALRAVAELIHGALRTRDVVGRYGGDEFLVILPQTRLEDAGIVAARIEQAVGHTPLEVDGLSLQLTVSVGAACSAEIAANDECFDIVEMADHRMLQRKAERCMRLLPCSA